MNTSKYEVAVYIVSLTSLIALVEAIRSLLFDRTRKLQEKLDEKKKELTGKIGQKSEVTLQTSVILLLGPGANIS